MWNCLLFASFDDYWWEISAGNHPQKELFRVQHGGLGELKAVGFLSRQHWFLSFPKPWVRLCTGIQHEQKAQWGKIQQLQHVAGFPVAPAPSFGSKSSWLRLVPLGGRGSEQLLLLLPRGTSPGNPESAKRGCKQCSNIPDVIGKMFHNLPSSQPCCPEPITHWPGAALSCWQAFLGGWFHLLAHHEGFHVCSRHSQGLQ